MRIKNGKRIGPMPIAVVAVFALAALLSAGLLVLIPGSTQAQTATGSLPDLTLDVGEGREGNSAILTVSVAADIGAGTPAVSRAFPVGATTFTISSDQDESEDVTNRTATSDPADSNGGIETNSSGSDDQTGAISIDGTSGAITIPAAFVTQILAEQADNTARITVKANDADDNPLSVRFDLTIVQNPLEESGDGAVNPDTWATATSSDCAVESETGTALESRDIALTPGATGTATENDHDVLISGGACTTVGNSVDVALRNTTANDQADREITYLVYVTGGGSSFSKVDGYPGKSGLNEELIRKLEKIDELGDPGEGTITVSRSMADKMGRVYLYGYFGGLADKRLKSTSEAFEENADFVVRVQFVEGPALAFDANRDDTAFDVNTDTNADDVNGSTLMAANPAEAASAQDKDKDGYFDGMYMIPSGSDVEIPVTATIMDANGNPLNAGDKDSRVDFSVMYVEGSDISDNAADYSSRQVMKKGSNTASINVDGWNNSSKAVKVTVSATYTSPMAPDGFDLGTVTLTRIAELPSAADFATYSCVSDDDQSTAAKGCMAEYKATAATRFGPEDYFVVYGKFEDSLGSATEDSPELELSADAKEALDKSVRTAMGYDAKASSGSVLVQVKKDAELGEYTLTVSNGRSGNNEVTQELTVFVAGPPVKYTVDPMGTHYTTSRRVNFTVSALDANDGVPHFTMDDPETTDKDESDNRVLIDAIDGTVRGVDDNDYLTLDPDTGMKTFTYTLPRDATAGEEFDVFIGEGDMQQTVTVVFGSAPAVPDAPGNVSASATSDTMITVSWDAPDDNGSAITGYALQRKSDGEFYTIAASSAAIWWNTLDCPMMNKVIPDDATPAPGSDDPDADPRSPYCYMYDGLSDDAEMVVKGVFADKIGMITGMSYMDSMLMANTEYAYRVSAVNDEGRGMWSDEDSATTMMPPTPPMATGTLDAVSLMVGDDPAMVDASGAFTTTEGDAITDYDAVSDNTAVATASANAMGMVTITAVGAGSAIITVTASDDDGESDPGVTIAVTVTAPPVELTAPQNVRVVLNSAGTLVVGWDAVAGADGYVVIAININDPEEDRVSAPVNDADATSYGLGGLTRGQTYNVYVASFDSETNILSASIRATAN